MNALRYPVFCEGLQAIKAFLGLLRVMDLDLSEGRELKERESPRALGLHTYARAHLHKQYRPSFN